MVVGRGEEGAGLEASEMQGGKFPSRQPPPSTGAIHHVYLHHVYLHHVYIHHVYPRFI